tara:strand:+ start:7173 stop:7973 length:801 start_codon:yes stop_codon:yes gene_type:complete
MKIGKLNLQGGKNINVAKRKVASAKGFMFNQHNVNISREGIRNLQQRICITETTANIVNATTTAIGINAIGNDVIKKNDRLVIVNPITGVATNIVVTADVKSSDTSISINTTAISSPLGSFIMYQEEFLNYYVRGGTITKKTTIANAAYKTLNTSPITLVTGVTGMVMIPVNLVIITNGYLSDDEGNNNYLYCGHGTTSTAGRFWDTIRSFNYRVRSNSTWNMTGDTGQIMNDSISGDGINLYSDADFESDEFALTVYLTYRIDSA